MTAAYYNEMDPFAAAWLRELIKQGHIAPGVVDERDIRDVRPDELREYTQCHFFAGIGVWSYALRRAGWPDDRAVWTGSCPCQPFSAAGRRGGVADERHLWPHWFHLITQCRPPVLFGEQVASKDGLAWLDLVQADLEGASYASGAVDLCAAGVGAPHIRQRLYFFAERVGHTLGARLEGHPGHGDGATGRAQPSGSVAEAGGNGGLADAERQQRERWRAGKASNEPGAEQRTERLRDACGLADARSERRQQNPGSASSDEEANGRTGWNRGEPKGNNEPTSDVEVHRPGQPGPTNGHWRDADWLYCRDGKWRPVEPGTFPLADGAPARVGRLRGYGNAINAEAGAAFIGAYLDGNQLSEVTV